MCRLINSRFHTVPVIIVDEDPISYSLLSLKTKCSFTVVRALEATIACTSSEQERRLASSGRIREQQVATKMDSPEIQNVDTALAHFNKMDTSDIEIPMTPMPHTDPAVPRYGGGEWDWLRGALATVDRDYGAVLNSAFHNIADTHVVHHLFIL
ncbi:hypothetical protein C2845_PM10G09380 [Panicum miliaceum]|uniref:Uncharacterized protein n=1 Tax=Panicum miliaceum TaxID=4540 RepID=A0A3L6PE35_PANMI|nr:hypothetical protein C2845_PM10G09380 [Panicum miliaceum]